MTQTQAYLYLGLAILAEVIATTALKASDSFTRPLPSIVTVGFYAVSFYLLTFSLRVLPTGTSTVVSGHCADAGMGPASVSVTLNW